MWLVTAAVSAGHIDVFSRTCGLIFIPRWWNLGCRLTAGIFALSLLSWLSCESSLACPSARLRETLIHAAFLSVMGYIAALLTMSLIAQRRDMPVWRSSVLSAHFGEPKLVTPRYTRPRGPMGPRSDTKKAAVASIPRPEDVRLHRYPPKSIRLPAIKIIP